MNITTILGLGIDYELFMVTRFREELHRQPTVEQAVARTVATAGRTVAVSGVTVAVALTSLMLFPETFLRSMGYGGVATVAVDMLAALTALRIRRSLPFSVTGHRAPREETSGGWGVHAVEGLDGGNVTHKVWRIASRARSPRVNVNVTNKVHPNRPEMAGVAGGYHDWDSWSGKAAEMARSGCGRRDRGSRDGRLRERAARSERRGTRADRGR